MSAMLLPKGRYTEKPVPAIAEHRLQWLAGNLGPAERRALRMIYETADLVLVNDEPYLIVAALDDLIDTPAAFEAEGEDRENDFEDEPQPDDEPTAGSSCYDEREPQHHTVPNYGMNQEPAPEGD